MWGKNKFGDTFSHALLCEGIIAAAQYWIGWTLAITPSHQQNTHDFADGRKNMNDIFNPHETARYGEIASAILNFFVCCVEMG